MSARKDDRSRFEKEYHRMTLIKHFANRHHPNIYQGFNGKYNSRHRSLKSREFSADIAQFFLQTLADNIFLR